MGLRPPFHAPWALLAALIAGEPAFARADLVQASPFLPPSLAGVAGQAGPAGPVELRGVMSTSQGTQYCIYDTAKKASTWVGLNETGNDFTVKSADPGGESVVVEFQGRTLKLQLRAAKVASSGSSGSASSPIVVPAVALNPTPADEQRRLDAIAAEVRRRRMEREKAAQAAPATPGAAPPGDPGR
jgi:hypothetical protein